MSGQNVVRQINRALFDGTEIINKKVTAIAATATLTLRDMGGIITNRGATGSIILTIPDASSALRGAWFEYFGIADQTTTFTAATADTLIAFNDSAVDSVAFSTSGEKIGAMASFFCDGTSWIVAGTRGTLSNSS